MPCVPKLKISPVLSLLIMLLSIAFMLALFPASASAQNNPTYLENQKQGTDSWELDNPADDVNQQIKGYASATSVNQGDTITIFVTTNPPQQFDMEFYRVGWYRNFGGRLMARVSSLDGAAQPVSAPDPTTGLLELDWMPSHTQLIPTDWTSGVYLVKLINEQGFDNYVPFVVRNDDRVADFLYQQPVTTYQAYNPFPDDNSTGKSLYDTRSYGDNTISGGPQAVKVSFDRPYTAHGAGDFFRWEHDLLLWMERSGYDITYTTNLDTHQNGAELLKHKVFVSPGHDEYWSKEMFDAAEFARDGGTHLAFMGANAVYWQVRFEASRTGVADRVMVGYKTASVDPEPNLALKTIRFRETGRPEQELRGVMWSDFNPGRAEDYVVKNSDHWIYDQTSLSDDDRLLYMVGYEVDHYDEALPRPAHTSWEILSSSPFVTKAGPTVIADTLLFQAPSGAYVFSSGIMSWSAPLNSYWEEDSRLQQMTANLFQRFVNTANAPIVTNPGNQSSTEGEDISLRIEASNPGSGTLTYIADKLPRGLSIDPNSGEITGRLSINRVRDEKSSVMVSNGAESASVHFTWQVNRVNAGGCHEGIQEAEWGRLFGNFMITEDPSASGGEVVNTLTGAGTHSFVSQDRVEYCFTTTQRGDYRVKGWMKATDERHDSIYVTINGNPADSFQWSVNLDSGYGENYLTDGENATPVTIELEPGEHQLILYQHEAVDGIDRLELELADDRPPLGDIVPIVPGDSIHSDVPTFQWQIAQGATQYKLLVRNQDNGELIVNQRFLLSEISCNQGICSVRPDGLLLVNGNYKWNVQAQNESITGPWSPNMLFVISRPEPPNQRLGDVNCDNDVNAVDALFVLQHVVQLRADHGQCPLDDSLGQLNVTQGDVNESGTIDSVDALQLLQCTVGIPNVFCPDLDVAQ